MLHPYSTSGKIRCRFCASREVCGHVTTTPHKCERRAGEGVWTLLPALLGGGRVIVGQGGQLCQPTHSGSDIPPNSCYALRVGLKE